MCPVKTENLSRNVPRPEGDFWRQLTSRLRVRSRANLENFLLEVGLKAVNRRAWRELVRLRAAVNPRVLGSGALLALFVAGLVGQAHGNLRLARGHVRAVAQHHPGRPGRDWEEI